MTTKLDHTHVKVEDLNMPFWAMVGFWIKAWLSFIFATLVISIIPLIVLLVISSVATISH